MAIPASFAAVCEVTSQTVCDVISDTVCDVTSDTVCDVTSDTVCDVTSDTVCLVLRLAIAHSCIDINRLLAALLMRPFFSSFGTFHFVFLPIR